MEQPSEILIMVVMAVAPDHRTEWEDRIRHYMKQFIISRDL